MQRVYDLIRYSSEIMGQDFSNFFSRLTNGDGCDEESLSSSFYLPDTEIRPGSPAMLRLWYFSS